MNYQELSGYAMSMPWAAKLKAETDAENVAILARRQALLDARADIDVGDFVIDGDRTLRVAHDWGDSVQLTDGRFGESFYLGDGYCDFSGGLDPAIDKTRFTLTEQRRAGRVWFFSENHVEAHNGYRTEAQFKVWALK